MAKRATGAPSTGAPTKITSSRNVPQSNDKPLFEIVFNPRSRTTGKPIDGPRIIHTKFGALSLEGKDLEMTRKGKAVKVPAITQQQMRELYDSSADYKRYFRAPASHVAPWETLDK